MKKLALLILMSALGLSDAYAQDGKNISTVMTEDGSLIHGIVSYEHSTVAITTDYGETVRVPLSRITRITDYQADPTKPLYTRPLDWGNIHPEGIYANFAYGFFIGSKEASGGNSFTTEIGWRFRPELNVGLSLGWTYYGQDDCFGMPIKAVFRSEFGKAKVAPIVALGLGYNISLDNGPYRGFVITPETGIVIRSAKKVTHSITILFHGSQYDAKYGGYDYPYYYYRDVIDYSSNSRKKFHWGFGLKYSIGI